MKRRSVVGLMLVVATAALVLLPGTAMAMAPTSEAQQFHRHNNDYIDCGSFQVIGDFDVSRTVVTYYDESGTPIRQVLHIDVSGTLTNSLTGASLPTYRHGGMVILDLVTGTLTDNGQVVQVNIPGQGSVFLETGRFIRDADGNLIFEAGPHPLQAYFEGDTSGIQELCAALS